MYINSFSRSIDSGFTSTLDVVVAHLDDYFQAAVDDKSQEVVEERKSPVVVAAVAHSDEHGQEEEEGLVPVQDAVKAVAVVFHSPHQGPHVRTEGHSRQEDEGADVPSEEERDNASESAEEDKTLYPSKQDELKAVLYVDDSDSSSVVGFSSLHLLGVET